MTNQQLIDLVFDNPGCTVQRLSEITGMNFDVLSSRLRKLFKARQMTRRLHYCYFLLERHKIHSTRYWDSYKAEDHQEAADNGNGCAIRSNVRACL